MFNLELYKKLNEVKEKFGVSVVSLLSSVPFGTVVTAFKTIPVPDLVEMVVGVSPAKLVHGLTIITPKQIEQVPVYKLKAVLFHGNMDTVQKLQESFLERDIIHALDLLPVEEIVSLLTRDDFEEISDRIRKVDVVVY